MAQEIFNKLYQDQGLNTGNFKLWYDFTSISGNIISSVSGGQDLFSGTIINQNNFFDIPGSGFFTGGYININNSTGLTGNNFTFIISQEKTGISNGTIFSNYSGNSGYSFGINDKNRIFFEYNTGSPQVKISTNNLANKNLFSVSKFNTNLFIHKYNFTEKTFESESFIIPNNLNSSDVWSVGDSVDVPIDSEPYEGYIDNFLYFNNYIDVNNLNIIASGLYLNDSSFLGQISITGIQTTSSGFVNSGIQTVITGFEQYSGDLYYIDSGIQFNSLSELTNLGIITDGCGANFNLYEYQNNSGVVVGNTFIPYSGELIVENSGTGFFTGLTSLVTKNVITGFGQTITLNTGIIQNVEFSFECLDECGRPLPIFTFNEQTGIVTGSIFTPLTGLISGEAITSVPTEINSQLIVTDITKNCGFIENSGYIDSFGYNSFVYLIKIDNIDTTESYYSPDLSYNFHVDSQFDISRKKFKLNRQDISSTPNLYLNGVGQNSGINYILQNNFRISGDIYSGTDTLIYDIITNTFFQSFDKTGTDYLLENDEKFNWVFLNGQKLISGDDYDNVGDNIILRTGKYFDGITGKIFTFSNNVNLERITGKFAYSILDNNRFFEDTTLIFLNGVKQVKDLDYREVSTYGLLSGSGIFENNNSITYNNTSDFFE